MTPAQAITLLTALTTLASQAAASAQKVSRIIESAQREGRDLNAEEIDQIVAMRKSAVRDWQQADAEAADAT